MFYASLIRGKEVFHLLLSPNFDLLQNKMFTSNFTVQAYESKL